RLGRGDEQGHDKKDPEGQGRGPHDARRSGTPFIYVSGQRVKSATTSSSCECGLSRSRRLVRRICDESSTRTGLSTRRFESRIAAVCGEVLRVRTVAEDRSGIHGPMRTPDVRVLWGDGTETVHKEGGVRYALDVSRIMFSSGNLAERVALPARVQPGAVVVDL